MGDASPPSEPVRCRFARRGGLQLAAYTMGFSFGMDMLMFAQVQTVLGKGGAHDCAGAPQAAKVI